MRAVGRAMRTYVRTRDSVCRSAESHSRSAVLGIYGREQQQRPRSIPAGLPTSERRVVPLEFVRFRRVSGGFGRFLGGFLGVGEGEGW